MTDTNKKNTGYYNTGDYNAGRYNTGDRNTGDRNTGDRNTGGCNAGRYNTGDRNTGDRNTGDCNTGNYNAGRYNTGDRNAGYYNTGYYNTGNYNSGSFNTDEPTIRLFNKDTGKKRSEITIPYIELKVTEWISDTKMTDAEKKANPQFHVASGYLKKRTYKEAWALAWSGLTAAVKQQFLDLPNFDADIFFEITGVDVRTPKLPEKQSCEGKVVEIDGKKYKLVEV